MAGDSEHVVGGAIQALCTRCKAPTRHVIVSVVNGRAAKVQCGACQGRHNFRDPGAAHGGGAPRVGLGKSSRPTLEEEWLARMRGRDPKQALPYGSAARPRAGDLVEHPSFGFGLVLKVLPPNRVEVHFRGGVRLLRWDL